MGDQGLDSGPKTGLIAIVRPPTDALQQCELTHLERCPIDLERALKQHRAYREMLSSCGATVEVLDPLPASPDATFVEDVAIVLDEVAVLCSMGAASRRAEVSEISAALSHYRELRWVELPACIEGGDVQRVGRTIFVGLTGRTDEGGIKALRGICGPLGYVVRPVPVTGCLHFKSACTALPDGRLLVNSSWVDTRDLSGFDLVHVPQTEPRAADVLSIGGVVVMGAPHPATAKILEDEGFEVRIVDLSEYAKAEAGVTCLSLVFENI